MIYTATVGCGVACDIAAVDSDIFVVCVNTATLLRFIACNGNTVGYGKGHIREYTTATLICCVVADRAAV